MTAPEKDALEALMDAATELAGGGGIQLPPVVWRRYRCRAGHVFEVPHQGEGKYVTFSFDYGHQHYETKQATCMECVTRWIDANFGAEPAPAEAEVAPHG